MANDQCAVISVDPKQKHEHQLVPQAVRVDLEANASRAWTIIGWAAAEHRSRAAALQQFALQMTATISHVSFDNVRRHSDDNASASHLRPVHYSGFSLYYS